MVEGGAHDETADAAESVDTDLDGHGCFSGRRLRGLVKGREVEKWQKQDRKKRSCQ